MRSSVLDPVVVEQPDSAHDVLVRLWEDVEQTMAAAARGPQALAGGSAEVAPVQPRRTERATLSRVRFAFD